MPERATTTTKKKIVVGSKSAVKLDAVVRAAALVFGAGTTHVVTVDAASDVPPQPVGYVAGVEGALHRAANAAQIVKGDVYVGIESFVECDGDGDGDDDRWFDRAAVVVIQRSREGHRSVQLRTSTPVAFEVEFARMARDRCPDANGPYGFSVTVGECMKDAGFAENDKDWYAAVGHPKSRADELVMALTDAFRFC